MGRFMGKKGTTAIIRPIQKFDNTFTHTDSEKAAELNSYFATLSTVDDTNNDLPIFRNRSDVEFTHNQSTETEVTDILKMLKINEATGSDGISNRMLKSTSNIKCVPLSKLFNL